MANDLARAKVVVTLTVTTTVEISDDGYLGAATSVADHVAKAKSDVSNFKLLIKQGSLEPKMVPATFVVTSVTIIPKET